VSIPLSLSNASNHSTTRWDCIEPSSALVVLVLDLSNRGQLVPTLQRRPPIIVSCNNATPACPIRKLSKENETVEASSSDEADLYPPLYRDAKGLFRVPRLPKDDATGRPPLSPKKKKASVQNSTLSNKMQVHLARKWAPKKPPKNKNKNKLNLSKGPTSPILTRKMNRYPGISSPRDKLLARKLSETLMISPKTSDPVREPLSLGTSSLLHSPSRSLSKTLFGIDNMEQAPVQPRRRPSTTPSPASRPKPVVSMMRLSEHSHSTDVTSVSTLSSKPSIASQTADLRVIPPPEPLACPPQAPFNAKNSRKRPISIRRLTQRR
jgi:hypothetical protein